MAEKKAKEQEKAPEKPGDKEIVGSGDAPAESKLSLATTGFKGFIFPAVVAAGLFALAMAASLFLQGSPNKVESSRMADSVAVTNDSVAPVKSTTLTAEDLLVIDFDTSEIMKELAFLDFNPEEEAPVDSTDTNAVVDTLSQIQKERALLAAEKSDLDRNRTELGEKENKVNQGLAKIEQAEAARIISLARLYDGMKAEEVARLFENLDDSLVVAIIPRMKPVNAAKLLALLPPKRAASISTQLITVIDN